MIVQNYGEILDRLEALIEQQIQQEDPLGYFSVAYRSAIRNLDIALYNQKFQDEERTKKVTLAFANRYFEMIQLKESGGSLPQAWELVVKTCRRNRISLIQHLLLIMQVRIQLDLPLAISRSLAAEEIQDFAADFKQIGKTLHGFYEELEEKVMELYEFEKFVPLTPGAFTPFSNIPSGYAYEPLLPLEAFKRQIQDLILSYTKQIIQQERRTAWRLGTKWITLPLPALQKAVARTDLSTKSKARNYVYPNFFLAGIFQQLNRIEIGNVSDKIRILMD